MGDEDDDEIRRLAAAGDVRGAAARMATAYTAFVRGYIRRRVPAHLADDLAGKVWLVVARKVPADLMRPRGWLVRIADNVILHAHDQRSFEALDSALAAKPMWRSTTTDPRGKVKRAEEAAELHAAITALPPRE